MLFRSANATINRSQGATVTWNGGSPGSYVIIGGSSSSTAGGLSVTASYSCYAPVSAGQFTVPPAILLQLPAGSGTASVENSTSFQPFTASGLDAGVSWGGVSISVNSTYN